MGFADYTETAVVEMGITVAQTPVGRAAETRIAVPCATAKHSGVAVRCLFRPILPVGIGAPFPHIAKHVIQSESVRLIAAYIARAVQCWPHDVRVYRIKTVDIGI